LHLIGGINDYGGWEEEEEEILRPIIAELHWHLQSINYSVLLSTPITTRNYIFIPQSGLNITPNGGASQAPHYYWEHSIFTREIKVQINPGTTAVTCRPAGGRETSDIRLLLLALKSGH
jgi:hypothetical protein